MKTDDRATRQRDEAKGDEAKVVRLSDWLAPDDELVPFGPRAHARTATGELAQGYVDPDSGAEPPAASGFWDGDPSVHTAVPGPGMFDETGGPTAHQGRYRRSVRVWRPALPRLDPFSSGSHARDQLVDFADWLSWRRAAVGVGFAMLALIVLVITLGGSSSGHHETAAQAGIGEPSRPALSGTLDEIGGATGAAAVSELRRLPPVDTAARTIGTAVQHARALQTRRQRHVVAAPISISSSSTTGSVDTPTTTPTPAETTPAPSETEPTQTTSSPPPTTGGASSPSGGGSSSATQKQSTFGATGSLGPGSSPNG